MPRRDPEGNVTRGHDVQGNGSAQRGGEASRIITPNASSDKRRPDRRKRHGGWGDRLGVLGGAAVVVVGGVAVGLIAKEQYTTLVESRTLSVEEHTKATKQVAAHLLFNLDQVTAGDSSIIGEYGDMLTASGIVNNGVYGSGDTEISITFGVHPGGFSAQQDIINTDANGVITEKYSSVHLRAPDGIADELLADGKVTVQEIQDAFMGEDLQLARTTGVVKEIAGGTGTVLNNVTIEIDETGHMEAEAGSPLGGKSPRLAGRDWRDQLDRNIGGMS